MRLTRGANLPLQRCRCRDLQVFQEPLDRRSPLARLSCTPMQACRVFGLFRPQVWWGDNSARRGGGSPSSAGSSTSGTSQKLALSSSSGAMASTSIELVGNLIENENRKGDRFIFAAKKRAELSDSSNRRHSERLPHQHLLSRRNSTPSPTKSQKQKSPRSLNLRLFHSTSGAPGGIRTHDPCLRRAVLYPAELRMLVRATSYPCRPDASIPAFALPPVVHFRQKMANRHPHSQLPAPHVPLFALLLWL